MSVTQVLPNGGKISYEIFPPNSVRILAYDASGEIIASASAGGRLVPDMTPAQAIDIALTRFYQNLETVKKIDIPDAILDKEDSISIYQDKINGYIKNGQPVPPSFYAKIKTFQDEIAALEDRLLLLPEFKSAVEEKGKTTLISIAPKPVPPTPPPTMAPTPAPTPAPAKAKLTGAADGDSGAKQANPAGTTGAPPTQTTVTAGSPKQPTPDPNVTVTSGAGTPPNASTGASYAPAPIPVNSAAAADTEELAAPQVVASKPGRRLKNPLGEFSSYTYQISLYMITPDAYDAFVRTGRTKINMFNDVTKGTGAGGAFLVAQSGGINNTTSKRAPGFEFDYYIDGLELVSGVNGASTQDAINLTSIRFKIIEPYGFSFVTNLRKAADELTAYAGGTSFAPENPSKQFFILGVRFFGYDASGRLMTGDYQTENGALDPNSVDGSLFETFYDITLTSINFKIDGKSTTYSCEASAMSPAVAFGVKKGMIHALQNINASTVGEAMDKLFEQVNKTQRDLKNKGTIKEVTTYSMDWSAPGASSIQNSSIVSPADLDKSKWAASNAKTTAQSNEAQATTSTPVSTSRQITFKEDTSMLAAINTVIAQSAYLENALKVVQTTALESDPKSGTSSKIESNTNKTISWYNCSTAISNARWDPQVADWAYDITYKIQKYDTPVINSPLTNPGVGYYGPHKRYSYWYTGKNSEVLQYEQTLNNTFFNAISGEPTTPSPSGEGGSTNGSPTTPAAGTSGNAVGGPTNVSQAPGIMANQPRLGKTGYGSVSQNSYITSLYDPASFAEATIKILGDPDFLVQESEATESQIYNQFYGPNGFVVNPNGGQVFIEIDFNEAVDYTIDGESGSKTAGGTLKINDQILFWKYPDSVAKIIQGVSYMVTEVTSYFSGGAFTQTLTAKINDFGDPDAEAKAQAARDEAAKTPPSRINPNGVGATPSNVAAGKGSPGTPQSQNFNSSNPKLPGPITTNKSPSQPTSQTGPAAKPVADDDGGKG